LPDGFVRDATAKVLSIKGPNQWVSNGETFSTRQKASAKATQLRKAVGLKLGDESQVTSRTWDDETGRWTYGIRLRG
jgi:hypothetical protein